MTRQIRSSRDLELEFAAELNGLWAHEYGDRQYVLQKMRAVFFWFDQNNVDLPKTREAWAKQIIKFCDNGLGFKKESEKKFIRESSKPTIPFNPLPALPELKECSFCDGLGYVWVYALDHSHDSLMRCDCVKDDASYEKDLPLWERGLERIYRRDPCPIEWFKPDNNDGLLSKSTQEKIANWINRKLMAKQFWADKKREFERVNGNS